MADQPMETPTLRYPKNQRKSLDPELFRHPSAEYRGAPFWAWNGTLEPERLSRQISVFKSMGMGGFHMHPRTGLTTEYLGDTFMAMVRHCVEQAERHEMLAWLYDEDRYPSGFAGGMVTREPSFRAQYLRCVPGPLAEGGEHDRRLFARYHIVLDGGVLTDYRRLAEHETDPETGMVWYAYQERWAATTWYNNQTYVDTLNPAAIERFVAITHERYARSVGAYFGGVIPAIFSDEPQFTQQRSLAEPVAPTGAIIPWTDDLTTTYHALYGATLEEQLPELFWELPDGTASVGRYQFHDHVAERLAQAFSDVIGAWCVRHGLALTGHVMDEGTLGKQTAAVGEAMRQYRSFGLPGIDILCDWREYTTAKQAQSVAHQCGRSGVLSELYGVTNWDFTFAGHKAQGDWQAALGVTVRVHHLAWYSMAGEAKRDYPASIGYQSPWHGAYRLVEDYFARLNTVLTRGQRQVRVGVIHPIESYWLCCGPWSQTRDERDAREHAFADVTEWLLFGQIDFDFISESMLPALSSAHPSARFEVGQAAYDVVLVPALRTLRTTTFERLTQFRAAGGTVIFAGEVPTLLDARPSVRVNQLASQSLVIPWSRQHILVALDHARDLRIEHQDGEAPSILYQLRMDGERRWMFLVNTDVVTARPHTRITLWGAWSVTVWDAIKGTSYALRSQFQDGRTTVTWDFAAHGSLLLSLEPGWTPDGSEPAALPHHVVRTLDEPLSVTLSEPNVLVLNHARYRLDDEPWQGSEEVLRIDTMLRQRLTLPLRMEEMVQPWAAPYIATPHQLHLAFDVDIEVGVATSWLALENAAHTQIWLDGEHVPSDSDGWYVDEAIERVPLPPLIPGHHELILTMPFDSRIGAEWCYLLGDFGVELQGRHTRVVASPRTLRFGDWTQQGFPFYAGNVTYHCRFASGEQRLTLQVHHFVAPILGIRLNNHDRGAIAFAPYHLTLGSLDAGEHLLDITVYGSRINAFGALHHANAQTTWIGPDAWRTSGENWTDDYQIKPMGLLSAPQLLSEQ